MRQTIVSMIAVLAGLTVSDAARAMSVYKWNNRPLIVFAPTTASPALAEQRRTVAAQGSGFRERDMVVIWVVGDAVTTDFGPGPGLSASALRARYGVGQSGFKAILVGKDGGEKLSSGAALSAAKLFSTIDAMPMRRDEVRRK